MRNSTKTASQPALAPAHVVRDACGGVDAEQFLSFSVAGDAHALPLLAVREILSLMTIRALPPGPPSEVRGIINLRGKVIPVVDLRVRFGLAAAADTRRTCIVVVAVETAAGEQPAGLVVDQVDEVIVIPADAIEPPPIAGVRGVRAVGKLGDRVVLVLDIADLVPQFTY